MQIAAGQRAANPLVVGDDPYAPIAARVEAFLSDEHQGFAGGCVLAIALGDAEQR
jgi:hypothetical protein